MPDDGSSGKKAGMSAADEAANEAWKAAADLALLQTAQACETLTRDDVEKRMPEGVTTHENRAWGPVMLRGARDGLIEKANDLPWRNCTRPSRHHAPMQVWRSLICGKEIRP
jgi:hypothetical protein